MAKRTRKKRQRKDTRKNQAGIPLMPILFAVALVILAVTYLLLPDIRRQQLHDSLSNAIETVKGKLEDRLAEVEGDASEPATNEKTEPSTSDRQLSYAGLPEATSYPYQITVLTNQGYISGYCEERKNPAWVSYRVFKLADAESPPRPSRFTVDARTTSRIRHDDYTRSGYDRGHMAPNYAIGSRYGAPA